MRIKRESSLGWKEDRWKGNFLLDISHGVIHSQHTKTQRSRDNVILRGSFRYVCLDEIEEHESRKKCLYLF